MSTETKYPKIKVKLTGIDGNAFAIIGSCRRAAKQAGVSRAEVEEFTKEAMSGDYDHLLQTCVQWFNVR